MFTCYILPSERTARYFFCFYIVLGKRKAIFVLVPINFLGGCTFFTPATESIGTYSIEVEFAAYYLWCTPLFFWCRYVMCLVCVRCVMAHIIVDAPLVRFNEVFTLQWHCIPFAI